MSSTTVNENTPLCENDSQTINSKIFRSKFINYGIIIVLQIIIGVVLILKFSSEDSQIIEER